MTIIVTGAAGFIGMHVSQALMGRGQNVIGIDNLNDYYDVTLKEARLTRLQKNNAFSFIKADISDKDAIFSAFKEHGKDVTGIINLAAQAGVRYSLQNPFAYIEANIMGHLVMMEAARHYCPHLKHFVYASSSSVYGGNKKKPFSVADSVDHPVSLYAATKKADELMAHTYAHLYRIPMTGLRFFTVYGPWGRPDMAAYLFADAIRADKPIRVFNHGNMKRDFTYIDDIVAGVLATLDNPPIGDEDNAPCRVFNLGNNRSEKLMDYIGEIEKAMGKEAIKNMEDIQPGDVPETYADIDATHEAIGYQPTTPISSGIPKFIAWYKDYYGIKN